MADSDQIPCEPHRSDPSDAAAESYAHRLSHPAEGVDSQRRRIIARFVGSAGGYATDS